MLPVWGEPNKMPGCSPLCHPLDQQLASCSLLPIIFSPLFPPASSPEQPAQVHEVHQADGAAWAGATEVAGGSWADPWEEETRKHLALLALSLGGLDSTGNTQRSPRPWAIPPPKGHGWAQNVYFLEKKVGYWRKFSLMIIICKACRHQELFNLGLWIWRGPEFLNTGTTDVLG